MYLIIIFVIIFIIRTQEIQQYDDPMHTSIIYGSSDLGYYYVNIYIGTPPQQQSVIIDTGSSITTIPCDACKQCGKHVDQYFIRNESNTIQQLDCQIQIGEHKCEKCDNKKNQCIFSISYAEGSSLMGFFLQDEIMFGDTLMQLYNQTNQQVTIRGVFGCTTSETNLFYTQLANGIIGLSPKTNTTFAFPNIVDEIYKIRNDLNYFFSICIGRLDGYMTIGQYDIKRHQQNSAYYTIPYHKNNNRDIYGVKISQIKVNNITIQAGADLQAESGSFIDSGSTLVNARSTIVQAMLQYFICNNTKCPQIEYLDGLACYTYNETQHLSFDQFMNYFPIYEFIMENNFIFQWTPQDYLTKDIYNHNAYCLPVAEYYGSSRMILGQVWMRNWDIGFNKYNQTITFVRSKCSSDPLIHNYTVDEQFRKERLQTNYIPKPRRQPKDIETGFIYELVIVGGIILLIIIFTIIYCIIKRRKNKQIKKGTKLPEQVDIEEKENVKK